MMNDAAPRARAFVLSSWLGCGYAAVFAVLNLFRDQLPLVYLNLGVMVTALLNLALYRAVRRTPLAGGIGLSILMIFALAATRPLGLVGIVWIYVVPIPAFYFLGQRRARVFLAAWFPMVVGWFSFGPLAAEVTSSIQLEVLASFALVCFLADKIEALRHANTLRIERLAAEAQQASRAKDSFLAQMSHELRTPLNAVLGFSQLMAVDPALPEHLRPQVKHIHSSGRALLELIGSILDFSRLESGDLTPRPEPVSLAALCDEALAIVTPLATAGRFQVVGEAEDVTVHVDPKLMKQAILAMLNAANRRAPAAGVIGVHWSLAETVDLVVARPEGAAGDEAPRYSDAAAAIVDRIARVHGGTVSERRPDSTLRDSILSLPRSCLSPAEPAVVG